MKNAIEKGPVAAAQDDAARPRAKYERPQLKRIGRIEQITLSPNSCTSLPEPNKWKCPPQ